jgi:hypothetical protein
VTVTTYQVEPDGDDTPTLWRAESEHDQYPQPLAFMTSVGNTATDNCDDRGVVFRAAAAVLAPSDALILSVAQAMFAAAGGGSWHAVSILIRDHWIGSAYAALAALRAHVEVT